MMADLPTPDEGHNLPVPYRPPQQTMFDQSIFDESRRQSGGPTGSASGSADYNALFLAELKAINANTQEMLTLLPRELADASNHVASELQNLQAALAGAGPPRGGEPSATASSAASTAGLEEALNRILGAAGKGGPKEPMGDIWGRKEDTGWRGRAKGGIESMSWVHFPGSTATPLDFLKLFGTMSADAAQKKQPGADAAAMKSYQAGLAGMVQKENTTLFADLLTEYGSAAKIPLDVLRKQESSLNQADLSQLQRDTKPQESRWGKVSDFFGHTQKAYAEGKTAMDLVQKMTRTSGGLADYAYQTGYQGGTTHTNLPFGLGQSIGAAEQALRQRAQQGKFSLDQHISVPQGRTIYDNLYNNGWYGGGSTDAMRTGAADLMRANPYIGSMPETYKLMDQATRYGATSIEHFNDVMKAVPDAALAAHTSIADMMNAMQSLGDYNKSTGGTFIQGMDNAKDWAQNTGTSPLVMQQLMQNPLVQGQTFMQTGLMPFEQGLASSGQHTQGILSSLNLLNRAIVTPKDLVQKDPITGLAHTISGQSQKEALMAKQLGVSPEYLHTMLRNEKGWQIGSEMQDAADTYKQDIRNDVRHGKPQAALDALEGAPYQHLQSALAQAKDAQGHHMFEDWGTFRKDRGHMSDAKAHALAQAQARTNITNAGDTVLLKDANTAQIKAAISKEGWAGHFGGGFSALNKKSLLAGISDSETRARIAQDILHSGTISGKQMTDVAGKRSALIKKYIADNTKKFGAGTSGNQGPHIQIELGPAAKKMFRLSDPKGQQKANNNAGSQSQSINVNVNGPTASPYPDLNTSGGSSTFQYGGPLDDGSS